MHTQGRKANRKKGGSRLTACSNRTGNTTTRDCSGSVGASDYIMPEAVLASTPEPPDAVSSRVDVVRDFISVFPQYS